MKIGMKSPQQLSARRGALALINTLASVAFGFVAINELNQGSSRNPVYLLLWAVWMLVPLLWVFGVPGYTRWSPAERSVINDELVRAHQAVAAKVGFALALICLTILSFGAYSGASLPSWSAIALTTATIAGTALAFAWLQHRDG